MRRLVGLLVVLVALLALSCGSACTHITMVNSGRDPFHLNGGQKLEVGGSGRVDLKHGSVTTVTLDRMGSTWATLEVTSTYDKEEEQSDHSAEITITEPTYGTFAASSDNENILVTVVAP